MIHFISGKPRGGKSLYAVRLVVDELVNGSRPVYTNLALKLGEVNAYIQREFPSANVNVAERVFLLDDEQLGEFWTYRPGIRIARLSKEEWRSERIPDYSAVKDSGIMYVLDEVHIKFGARQWAETGRDVIYYLSQHGKLGDTVLCVTQHVQNVDKQFRSVAQDYTYIRNLSKLKLGMFTMPKLFVRQTFDNPATDTSKNKALETGSFKLDVSGLASCYDTAKGVGIHGRMGDKLEKRKGVPWYVGVVVLVALIIGVAVLVPQAVGHMFSTPEVGQRSPFLRSANTNAVVLRNTGTPPALPVAEPGRFYSVTNSRWYGLQVVGTAKRDGGTVVYFDNGEDASTSSGEVESVGANIVKMSDGALCRWQHRARVPGNGNAIKNSR